MVSTKKNVVSPTVGKIDIFGVTLSHVGAILRLSGAKLAHVGAFWPHVGPMLGLFGLMLVHVGSKLDHVVATLGRWAAQEGLGPGSQVARGLEPGSREPRLCSQGARKENPPPAPPYQTRAKPAFSPKNVVSSRRERHFGICFEPPPP